MSRGEKPADICKYDQHESFLVKVHKMPFIGPEKRFGSTAIKKGFITPDQLISALKIQISNEQNDESYLPIGELMKKMGFMTDEQVKEVISSTLDFAEYKCPNCCTLLQNCPNCGADLIKT